MEMAAPRRDHALRSYLEAKEALLNGPLVSRYTEINSVVDERGTFWEGALTYSTS